MAVLTVLPNATLPGRRPDHLEHPADGRGTVPTAADEPAGVPLRRALGDQALWWLAAALVAATLATTTVTVHLVAYLRGQHYSAAFAAAWTGLLGAGSVGGRILVTVLGRRWPLAPSRLSSSPSKPWPSRSCWDCLARPGWWGSWPCSGSGSASSALLLLQGCNQTMLIQMATTVAPTAPPVSADALPMELARALGDPLRWRIVELLSTEQLCVAHLAEELETAQPLVSHHLKVLRQAGLIEPDRYRYWTYYRLRPGALVHLAATLGLIARSAPSGTACRRIIPGTDPTASLTAARPSRQGGPAMPDGQLDPTSRATFARSIESLHEEFRGIYSLETIERFVDESIDRLSGARVVDFIPLFVHRFARERLRALAQAEGALVKDVPEVLFVCVHNAGRSQMAAALLDHHAKGQVHVRSA